MSDKRVRVLVVDDEQQIRDSLKFFLNDMEYETYTAGSFKETFNILEKVELHVIIVDLALPDGDGEKLIKEIAEKHPTTKFIIHTGSISYTPSERHSFHQPTHSTFLSDQSTTIYLSDIFLS